MQKATFAAPASILLANSFMSAFPPPTVVSAMQSFDYDVTDLRETLDVFFNPERLPYESLLIFYAQAMLGTPQMGSGQPAAGTSPGLPLATAAGIECAVFCHSEEQFSVATQVYSDPRFNLIKVLRSSSYMLFQQGGQLDVSIPSIPHNASSSIVVPSANEFIDILSPGSTSSDLTDPTRHNIMGSVDGSMGAGSSMTPGPLSAHSNPSLQNNATTSSLLVKARTNAVAVDQLADVVKALSLRLLPEREASLTVSRLNMVTRTAGISARSSSLVQQIPSTSSSYSSSPGLSSDYANAYGRARSVTGSDSGADYSSRASSPSTSGGHTPRSMGSTGLPPGAPPLASLPGSMGIGPAAQGAPIKVPKPRKSAAAKAASAGGQAQQKRPKYLQSMNKDGWHLQSYFKV
ncbi:hypothetical protein HDV05_008034 [Chytridiales sp. JEL 0842]|nr:hypothetical protein HDV05_008034 [Chytridiales sp. JEL 0842]